MANTYLKEGRSPDNRNDCSVIALAYAFDLPYQKAYDICKKAGRKHNEGFHLWNVLKVNRHKKSKQIFGRRVGWHDRPKSTVGKFQKRHPKGIYIIRVGGHIFTMIDGVIFNQYRKTSIISYYYYVSKPKQNDSTLGQQEVDATNSVRQENENYQTGSQQLDEQRAA